MRKRVKKIVDVLDDFGMFGLTLACVFLSSYLSAFKSGDRFVIDWSLSRLLVSIPVALMVTAAFELRGLVRTVDPRRVEQIKLARRKNAWIRILVSILCGFAWPSMYDGFLKIFGVGGSV